jgi:hypothetical protein
MSTTRLSILATHDHQVIAAARRGEGWAVVKLGELSDGQLIAAGKIHDLLDKLDRIGAEESAHVVLNANYKTTEQMLIDAKVLFADLEREHVARTVNLARHVSKLLG